MSMLAPPRGWIKADAALASNRAPTPAEAETIQMIHDLCREWQRGLPELQVRQLSTGGERWTAARFTPPRHVMFAPLMAMLDALIRTDVTDTTGMQYQTPHGTFSEMDIRSTSARVFRTADGLIRLLFPARYPWRRKPNADIGDPGEAAEPMYAETADERREMANSRTVDIQSQRRVVD